MYTLWVYESNIYNSCITTCIIYTANDDYNDVRKTVAEKYNAEWHTIASHLGISRHKIDNINSDHRLKCEECMLAMIDVWLRRVDKKQQLPTWRGLCEALATVNRTDAEKIAEGKQDCVSCSHL